VVVAACPGFFESVVVVSFPTTGVDVAIISGVDVAISGVLVAASGTVDVALDVAVVAVMLLLFNGLVGFEYEESKEFHVLPRLAGIA